MALYQYRDLESGQVVEIVAPMAQAPEIHLVLDGRRLERIWELPAIVNSSAGEVNHRGQDLPVSHSLPRDPRPGTIVRRGKHAIREHSDGTCSTMDGSRIIDGNKAAREACAQTGYRRDPL